MDVQVDWKRLKDLVAAIRQQQDLTKPTSSSLRKNLQSPVLQAALMTLTMLDSIALNCGPAVRTTLAERKWMEALLGACAGSDSRAVHIAQLLANWTCAFEGEPLAQASQAVLQALQQRGWQVPVALPEAHHHAEVVRQGFPLRNFHRGCDFLELEAHSHAQAGPQRSSSGASGELLPAGVGAMPQPAAGNSLRRLVRSLSGRKSGPASPTSPAVTLDAQPGSFIEPREHGSSWQPKELAVDDRLQDMRQVRDELLALERQCLEALDRGSTWQVQHAIGHGDSLAQTLEQFSMDLQAMVFAEAGAARLAEVLDLNDQLGIAVRRWQETLAHLAVAASSAEAKVREGQAEREQVVGHSQFTSGPTLATAPLEWHGQRHEAGLSRDAPSAHQQQVPSAADWPVLPSSPPAAHSRATGAPDPGAAISTSAQVQQQQQQQPQAGRSLSMYPTTDIDFTPAAVPWDAFQSMPTQAQVSDDQGQQPARGVSQSGQAQPQVPAEQARASLWSRPAQARAPAEHSQQQAGEALQSRATQPQATVDGSKQPAAPLPVPAGQRLQSERQALPEDAFSDLGRDVAGSSSAFLPSSGTFARSSSPESYSGSEQSLMQLHSRPTVQAAGAPFVQASPQPGSSQASSPFANAGSPSQNEPGIWAQAGHTDPPLAGGTASWQRLPSAGASSKSLGSLSDDSRSHRAPLAAGSSARSLTTVAQSVPQAVHPSRAAASSSRFLNAVEQSVPQVVRPSPAAASSTRSLGAVDQSVPLASLVESSKASSLNPATASRTTSFDSWAVAAPEHGASDQWGIQELSGFEGVSFPVQQEVSAYDEPGPDMGQRSAAAADGSPDSGYQELATQVQQLQHQLRQLQAAQADAEAAHSAEVKELKRRAVAKFKDMAGQLDELQAQCAARKAEAEELRGQVQQRDEEAVQLQRRLQRSLPFASADVEPPELDGRIGQQQEGARPLSAGSTADLKQAASTRNPHATPSRAMEAYWKQPSLRLRFTPEQFSRLTAQLGL